jgi:hypothetical protein
VATNSVIQQVSAELFAFRFRFRGSWADCDDNQFARLYGMIYSAPLPAHSYTLYLPSAGRTFPHRMWFDTFPFWWLSNEWHVLMLVCALM